MRHNSLLMMKFVFGVIYLNHIMAGYDPIAIAASLIKQNAGTISKVATGEESRR